jgi:hypothetical protein
MPAVFETENCALISEVHAPSPDPLRCHLPLPLEGLYYPMGFPVRISTDSPLVLQAAEEVWGVYTDRFGGAPLELRIGVTDGNPFNLPPAAMPTARGHLITFLHSADNFLVADLDRGYAYGWLTHAVVSDAGYLRYHFIEPLVYFMLEALYLAPVHAACVALAGEGILLCGASGAGKSSLAYACARNGWTYLSDDASELLRQGNSRRILGRPYGIRFRSSAAELFPELAAYPAAPRANGKLDIEVRTADLRLPSIACETRAAYIVFLRRESEGPAHIEKMQRDGLDRWFHMPLCFGEQHVRQQQARALDRLLDLPIFELTYSGLDSAEQRLRELVGTGA